VASDWRDRADSATGDALPQRADSDLWSTIRAMERLSATRPPAAYTLVADQLRLAIQMGHYLPGDQFPPERELAVQLGVSRTTIREAARVLEGEGLVEQRYGRTGGLRVLERKLSRTEVRRLLRERREYIDTVFDFRVAVEGAAARLAAERRRKVELARMTSLLGEMSAMIEEDAEGEAFVARWRATDTAFHMSIAKAARNAMLEDAVARGRAEMFHPISAVFTKLHPHMNENHAELVQAIEGQDAATAEKVMAQHINVTREAVHRYIRTGTL
jgi:DNA-binding FadR family transcriptional regulator